MNKIKLIVAAMAISLPFSVTSSAEENGPSGELVSTYSAAESLDTATAETAPAIEYPRYVAESGAAEDDETIPPELKHEVVYDGATPKAGDIILRSTVKLLGPDNGGNPTNCSGTLIARNVVLTAAHCVTGGKLSALFNDGNKFRSIHVKQAVLHPQYQELKKGFFGFNQLPKNDVALLFLAENAEADFQPASLPSKNLPAEGNSVVAGFGLVKPKQFGNNSLPHWSKAGFQAKGDTLVLSGVRMCGGDSGGPTYVPAKNGLTVIGIHSAGDKYCNDSWTESTDMNVSFYLAWIQNQLAAHRGTDI
jgi:hypothetical protein